MITLKTGNKTCPNSSIVWLPNMQRIVLFFLQNIIRLEFFFFKYKLNYTISIDYHILWAFKIYQKRMNQWIGSYEYQ